MNISNSTQVLNPQIPNGILIVDKPQGITSHGVISRLRRALGLKKIGHAGTLDPMATGLIVAGVGPMTRFLSYLVGLDKVYLATIRIGAASSTEDAEGEISIDQAAIAAHNNGQSLREHLGLSPDALEQAIETLRGNIEQVPSAVSAIKVDGKRAYQRVRDGEEVVLKARAVTIYEFSVLEQSDTNTTAANFLDLEVRVHCSSGTYIRALARDLGLHFGLGAHLIALRRTRVGPMAIEESHNLDEIVPAMVNGGAVLARQLFASIEVDDVEIRKIMHGQKLAYDEAARVRISEFPARSWLNSEHSSAHPNAEEETQDAELPIAAVQGERLVAMLKIQGSALHPETVFGAI
ncbi:MAG: tRNA pseudouridine(55) synthase TruB [Microbacteriaceae bacterium]